MQYEVISSDSWATVEQKVKEYLKDGWKPQGGIAVSIAFSPFTTNHVPLQYWAQAMVKEEQP